ncbi:PSD1 and planctomycete cytochrome C domain-containing protein [Aureliella helgolandensis]|uniref:PSD1 and planctomycete cytochrome C domain-containing protein n=1 Tax=Aureliella helgolandensis TaxID=2527968 RepID=UPI001E52E8C1|nr:PSD1 and planctomycete cytochrome C domain-containing protein [Aureliella helgolandensis]
MAESPSTDVPVDFSRDIRPLLSDNCFKCHGPDEGTREADLRLDTEPGLAQAITPGDAAGSSLVERILSHDDDLRMPPQGSNKSLSEEEQQSLVAWIEQGAQWQQHWSFVSPALPEIPDCPANPINSASDPTARDLPAPSPSQQEEVDDWCRNEIDRFILAKLTEVGLSPSLPAEPHTLVRRLYLDLIGLPPSPEEANEWIARVWPDYPRSQRMKEEAYQALVTHLLNSPHYGERWARRWLDLARYADTNGYEKDRDRSIWPYRDWVVNALNADMPFDQFTIEQLAGDMLPGATQSQRIATGFHRNTMLNEEGGIDPLEFRYHAMTDRVATTGTTWMGLTLGCCQCHTHKYDPITHTEYFQIMAFLNNSDEPMLELPEENFQKEWAQNRARGDKLLAELSERLQGEAWPPVHSKAAADAKAADSSSTAQAVANANAPPQNTLETAFAQWLEVERANAIDWSKLRPIRASSNLPILTIQDDHSIFASGDTAKRDDYVIEFAPSDAPITAIRLECLPDDRLPARGPGTTYYEGTLGDFFLTELKARSGDAPLPFLGATESYAKNRFGSNPVSAALALDGDVQTGWSVDGRQGERHVAVFALEHPLAPGQPISIQMTFGRHFASSLGRFRFSAATAPSKDVPQARAYAESTARLLRLPAGQLSAADQQILLEAFLLSAPELADETAKIRKLLQRPEVTTTLVMAERPSGHDRPTFRHHRGEYLQPEESVKPGIPDILPPLPAGEEANRLGFARWLVTAENPLTARVAVNRQWEAFFGTGLVKTVDDFGFQGDSPSHPRLLDWLAVTFRETDAWSMKKLHRRLVSSATYRQSSVVDESGAVIDPENRLLSRMPRFRLDAEVIRDSLLVVSGEFSPELGGPPVRPLQPTGVTEVAYGNPTWQASSGEARYRRSLYTFAKRTAPFAMFAAFDAPSGEACLANRPRSNSPLQALTLLNDVMLIDLARATGRKYASLRDEEVAEHETGKSQDSTINPLRAKLTLLHRALVVRPPTAEELDLVEQFYAQQLTAFRSNPPEARELLGPQFELSSSPAAASTSPDTTTTATRELSESERERLAEVAAWTATARAMFAIDEVQSRE